MKSNLEKSQKGVFPLRDEAFIKVNLHEAENVEAVFPLRLFRHISTHRMKRVTLESWLSIIFFPVL